MISPPVLTARAKTSAFESFAFNITLESTSKWPPGWANKIKGKKGAGKKRETKKGASYIKVFLSCFVIPALQRTFSQKNFYCIGLKDIAAVIPTIDDVIKIVFAFHFYA